MSTPTTPATETSKKPRDRSPAYPTISLKEALDRASKLHEKEGFHPVAIPVALRHWDFEPLSSTGMRVIAALKYFGLLTIEGENGQRRVRLTDLARRIIRDQRPGSLEREAAIREAALKPKVYAQVLNKHPEGLPSDVSLEHELEHVFKFNPNSIPGFIKDFKATLAFAKVDKAVEPGDIEADSDLELEDADRTPADLRKGKEKEKQMATAGGLAENPTVQDFQIPLGRGATAVLSLPVPISTASFKLVQQWLTLMAPAITEDPTDTPPQP